MRKRREGRYLRLATDLDLICRTSVNLSRFLSVSETKTVPPRSFSFGLGTGEQSILERVYTLMVVLVVVNYRISLRLRVRTGIWMT